MTADDCIIRSISLTTSDLCEIQQNQQKQQQRQEEEQEEQQEASQSSIDLLESEEDREKRKNKEAKIITGEQKHNGEKRQKKAERVVSSNEAVVPDVQTTNSFQWRKVMEMGAYRLEYQKDAKESPKLDEYTSIQKQVMDIMQKRETPDSCYVEQSTLETKVASVAIRSPKHKEVLAKPKRTKPQPAPKKTPRLKKAKKVKVTDPLKERLEQATALLLGFGHVSIATPKTRILSAEGALQFARNRFASHALAASLDNSMLMKTVEYSEAELDSRNKVYSWGGTSLIPVSSDIVYWNAAISEASPDFALSDIWQGTRSMIARTIKLESSHASCSCGKVCASK